MAAAAINCLQMPAATGEKPALECALPSQVGLLLLSNVQMARCTVPSCFTTSTDAGCKRLTGLSHALLTQLQLRMRVQRLHDQRTLANARTCCQLVMTQHYK